MSLEAKKFFNSFNIMFLAAALFFLAGAVWIAGWFAGYNTVGISMGAMWFAIGSIWIALGAAARKNQSSGQDVRKM